MRGGGQHRARIEHRLLPSDDPPDDEPKSRSSRGGIPVARENLQYRVELWDEAKRSVEQVLAVTASASIGYAAYFAATREFPQRCITLRHRDSVLSRWNGATH
jgi:hypothetical protein